MLITSAAGHRSGRIPLLSFVACALLICGIPRGPALALDARSLGQQLLSGAMTQSLSRNLGSNALQANRLAFMKKSGQISAPEYQARYQANRAELARLQQSLAQLPRPQQAEARRQAQEILNQGMVELKQQAQQWEAQQRQQQQQAREQAADARQRQQLEARQQQAATRQQQAAMRQQQLDAQRAQEQARQQQVAAAREQQARLAQEQRQQAQDEQTAQAAQRLQAQQAQRDEQQQAAAAGARAVAGVQAETAAGARSAPGALENGVPLPPGAGKAGSQASSVTAKQVAAARAKGATDFVPPPPPAAARAPSSGGHLFVWVGVLLAALGAILYFLRIRRRPSSPALPPDTADYLATPGASEVSPQVSRATSAAAASRSSPSATPRAPVPQTTSLKERLLAEQTAKYQVTLTAAMDELTGTQMALEERRGIPDLLRKDLLRIGGLINGSAKALMRERLVSKQKAVVNAFMVMPLWRLFGRGGAGFKIVLLLAVLWMANAIWKLVATGAFLVPLLAYAVVVVPLCYFLERRAQLKGPVKSLEDNATNLEHPALIYFYAEQTTTGPLWALRAWSASHLPPCDEAQLKLQNVDPATVPGSCCLAFGELATFRVDDSVAPRRIASNTSDLITQYGSVVDDAIAQHNEALAPLIKHIRHYGELKWRERRQLAEIPRLETLLGNVRRLEEIWRPVYVSEKVFEFLIRRIDLFNLRDRATPAGLLLHGYPGNGKELLARRIAQSVFAQFVKPNADQLTSAKSIKELWAAGVGKGPMVLFIEYADQVFGKPGSENEGSREATLAWLEEWTRNEPWQVGTWVVMTAQSEQGIHPRIAAMLGSSKIEITAPDAAGRELILENAILENKLVGAIPRWLIEDSGGASVRELRDIVRETKVHCMPDPPQEEHWRIALRAIRSADAAFKDESKTWDRLVLPAEIKQQLQQAARILRESERYKGKADVPNILLFGPPGTGKTDIARTIANESGVKFIEGKTADLKAQYQGQSAHLVRDLFARARAAAPCVLFLDELESVAAKRGTGDSFTNDIVTQMLTEMEGAAKAERPIIVLAATNLPEKIDDAIKRRFTFKIEIPLPDETGRRELLKRFIAERPTDPALDVEEIAAFLAKRLNRNSGSALADIVKRAMQRAVAESAAPEDVLLTREHLIQEGVPQGKEVSEADLAKIWAQLVLQPAVKEDILDKIRMFNRADKAAPKGLLLYGPPGTGKTEIARRIADSASCFFMALKGPDLKAGYVGQSGERVQKIWEQARSRGRCVIFIDECEGVFARRGGTNSDSASEELVQAFLAEWDGVGTEEQRVWVVGATNRKDILDEAITSRFGAEVEIGLPGAAERLQILGLEMAKLERPAQIPAFMGPASTGLSGRTLSRLAVDVCTLASKQGDVIDEAAWREALKRYVKAGSESVDPGARWDTLILADETLNKLRGVCESLRHIETLRTQGVAPPKGALLFGPPGTGKTQIARTLANESGLPFIAAATADLKAGFTGQSVQKVRELFERARGRAPCILFIDEIDAIAPARGGGNSDTFTVEIVNQLLQEMDGIRQSDRHVYVLAATNRPETVDEAIRSRLKDTIEIPNPDKEQRARLFLLFLSKLKTDFDVARMAAELAQRTGNIGGRAVGAIVERASQEAVTRAIAAGTADNVVLSAADLLREVTPRGREVTEADLAKIWEKIVLKPEVQEALLDNIRMFNRADKAAPKGLLLYGPPGTGKTEIARRIADSASCYFMALKGPDLKAGFVGQSGERVKKVWEQARARGRCVIFVDECEGVFARRGGTSADSASAELVQAFLAEWDGVGSEGQQVWVVGATNRRDLLDDAIVSRFGAAVEVALPDAAERMRILQLEMEKLERPGTIPAFLAQVTTGLSGRNLSRIASEVCTLASKHAGVVSDDLWREVLKRHTKAGSEAVDDAARWDSLILPEETLEKLRTLCESLRNVEEFKAQGFEVPKGALLYGPPGTGKTQIARTLANESGLPFIAATTADMKAGFVGQSGQKVRELFERARGRAPCILFIDEIEAVAASRSGAGSDSFTAEIVNQLLQEMDGVRKAARHVFVLAATNLPGAIDPAVLSRFEERIEIGNPDLPQREQLFRLFLGKLPADFDRAAVAAELAAFSNDIGGRDIRSVIQKASQKAIRRAGGKPQNVMLTREDLFGSLPSTLAPITASVPASAAPKHTH